MKGWKRLWLVATVAILIMSVFYTVNSANVSVDTGSSWYCVPGSKISWLEQVEDGYREPTDSEVQVRADELRRLGFEGSEAEMEMQARFGLGQTLYRDQTFFSCSAYWWLVRNLLLAGLLSLALAGTWMLSCWVRDGFERT